ncbi:hypothetical protein T4A_8371 [Trichinella pseudospiralis]|uniref:Uncharacterized protein n=1 Tax=Trichinella pseudospiralis TaxID=6337 RepID=A0A0V1CR81_TRIPS|nr:hypothetical protein T4A_8371 [Trichinella pseudospiralis]
MQTLPCSLGRWSARFPTLEWGKPRLSALKRGGEIVRFACPTEWGRVQSSLLFGQVERTLPDPGAGKA